MDAGKLSDLRFAVENNQGLADPSIQAGLLEALDLLSELLERPGIAKSLKGAATKAAKADAKAAADEIADLPADQKAEAERVAATGAAKREAAA